MFPDELLHSVPLFWPMIAAADLVKRGSAVTARNLKFLDEEIKLSHDLKPKLATKNVVRLDLRTMLLREYGTPGGIPTLIDAPYAGHTAMIADYHDGQSLVQTLLANGHNHVLLTDWKSATQDMKDLEIDNYLADMVVAIDDLGGKVNLIGLCQGGWMSAMVAARFPDKVQSLVLAGSPIDCAAGQGPIKKMATTTPYSYYEELVALGGGLFKGSFMLSAWKSMHPEQHYVQKYIDLYEHINDPTFVAKEESFESWYENPLNLPGRWYLQAVRELFQGNKLFKGEFVALGRKIALSAITCPTYLLGGAADDITTPDQVLAAAAKLGTDPAHIASQVVPGGHIGLFMGARTLKDSWPGIARWVVDQTAA